MAKPTELGPLNAFLKRRWGVVGPSGPVVTIASDVFPMERVDLGMDPDLHYLADQRICAAGRFDAASVGGQSSIGLENPLDSGTLAIVFGLSIWPDVETGNNVEITLVGNNAATFPAFDASANGGIRDARPQVAGESLSSVCIIGDRTVLAPAGVGVQVGLFRVGGDTSKNFSYLGPWVLSPTSRLTVNNRTDNVGITVSFKWIERRLGPWEV